MQFRIAKWQNDMTKHQAHLISIRLGKTLASTDISENQAKRVIAENATEMAIQFGWKGDRELITYNYGRERFECDRAHVESQRVREVIEAWANS